ncbi:transposase [Neisseriaceae bacterium B1]
MQSIPAVGKETSLHMAVLYRSPQFTSAAQMAALLGLIPKEKQSGKFKGKVMLSKRGNSKMRALLYMPAVVAKRYNPDIQAHYEVCWLVAKQKCKQLGQVCADWYTFVLVYSNIKPFIKPKL